MNAPNPGGQKVVSGKYGDNAGLPGGVFGIYCKEFAVGVIRTDESGIELTRDIDIVGIATSAGNKAAVLAAQHGLGRKRAPMSNLVHPDQSHATPLLAGFAQVTPSAVYGARYLLRAAASMTTLTALFRSGLSFDSVSAMSDILDMKAACSSAGSAINSPPWSVQALRCAA